MLTNTYISFDDENYEVDKLAISLGETMKAEVIINNKFDLFEYDFLEHR
jgi:hypothetical protein